ncbi:hypothetical protein [Clostridium botulinum]|uniref:hypothetical protein n=1 Tax=Clostridium botulinum TaxID=1491 RepID=UPI0004D6A664|nr:hypothetical protein [Clostridium botulinum]KEH90489.1 hypothetical protein Z963_p0046 [Clostridium botulinum C/D str. It1]
MSRRYKTRPSQILNIEDSYTAYCFDEACDYLIEEFSKENPPEPHWIDEDNKKYKNKTTNSKTIEWMMKHSKPIG